MTECRCCGGTMLDAKRCGPPNTTGPCKYFGYDEAKLVGTRFVCLAEGRIDGKCNGELDYVQKVLDGGLKERATKWREEHPFFCREGK
jgi:hypothetical protein